MDYRSHSKRKRCRSRGLHLDLIFIITIFGGSLPNVGLSESLQTSPQKFTVFSRCDTVIGKLNCDCDKALLDGTLTTLCTNDSNGVSGCRVLLQITWRLADSVRELMTNLKLTMLQVLPIAGRRSTNLQCKVGLDCPTDIFNFSVELDYDCCDFTLPEEKHAVIISVRYNDSTDCQAGTTVQLRPEARQVDTQLSPTISSYASQLADANTTHTKPVPASYASSEGAKFSMVQAAVVIALFAVCTVVAVIVVYILCVKRRIKKSRTEPNPAAVDEAEREMQGTSLNHDNCERCFYDAAVRNARYASLDDLTSEGENEQYDSGYHASGSFDPEVLLRSSVIV